MNRRKLGRALLWVARRSPRPVALLLVRIVLLLMERELADIEGEGAA